MISVQFSCSYIKATLFLLISQDTFWEFLVTEPFWHPSLVFQIVPGIHLLLCFLWNGNIYFCIWVSIDSFSGSLLSVFLNGVWFNGRNSTFQCYSIGWDYASLESRYQEHRDESWNLAAVCWLYLFSRVPLYLTCTLILLLLQFWNMLFWAFQMLCSLSRMSSSDIFLLVKISSHLCETYQLFLVHAAQLGMNS